MQNHILFHVHSEEFSLVSEQVKKEYQRIAKTGNKLLDASKLLQGLIDTEILFWSESALPKLEVGENEVSVKFDSTSFCTCSRIKIQEKDNSLFFVKNFDFIKDSEQIGFFKINEGELPEAIAQEIVLSRDYSKLSFLK